MSDFDKEAEREKLRKKFEDEGRGATEQMSELLLKGATMTNAHCTECGDPVFRYDGQEFCPTCQKPVDREQSDADDENIHVTDPSDDARVTFGGENGATEDNSAPETDGSTPAPNLDEAEPTEPAESELTEHEVTAGDAPSEQTTDRSTSVPREPPTSGDQQSDPGRSTQRRASDTQSEAPTARSSPDPPTTEQHEPDATVSEQLSAAESRLAETVHRFSERAAATDDPRRAREYLDAAREAAETLDAVRF